MRERILRNGWLAALAFVVTAGCSDETSILLVMDGDLRPGTDLDQVRVQFSAADQVIPTVAFDVTPDDVLPQSLRIWAGDAVDQQLDVRVAALLEAGEVLAVARGCEFEQGRQAECRVCLWRRCIGSNDEGCLAGLCEGVDGDADGDADLDGDVDGDTDADGDADGDADLDGDVDGDIDVDGDADLDGDADGDIDADGDADLDGDADEDGDADIDFPCTPEECDDGLFCNGLEACTAEGCVDGTAPDLEDDIGCTLDSCDEDADLVRHEPRDELCADLDDCTTDICDEVAGCRHGPPDRDADGFLDGACPGGVDCDDDDPLVNPDADEVCGNLIDDDCDSDVDWDDADCPEGHQCTDAIPLPRPGTYHGTIPGGILRNSGSCGGSVGDEKVHRFELSEPSSVHATTWGSALDMVLYLRGEPCTSGVDLLCDNDGAGIPQARLDLFDLPAGAYFVFTDTQVLAEGGYDLNIDWAPVGCGNGFLEAGEECDDGNTTDGDTCSADCRRLGTYALVLDGVDDSVVVRDAAALDLTPPFTVELWFRIDDLGAGRMLPLLQKGEAEPSYVIWVMAEGRIQAGISVGGDLRTVRSDERVTDGEWHHVALTVLFARMSLYVDGREDSSRSYWGAPPVNDEDLTIGNTRSLGTTYWAEGAIDEVRISSTARYDRDRFTPERHLAVDGQTELLLRFDEGSGRYTRDRSAHAFLGLVNGCTWEPE